MSLAIHVPLYWSTHELITAKLLVIINSDISFCERCCLLNTLVSAFPIKGIFVNFQICLYMYIYMQLFKSICFRIWITCTSVVGQEYNFKIWRQTNCAILKLESRLKTMFWPEKQNFLGIKLPNHMDVKSYGCQVIWVLHRNNQDGRKTPYVLIELTVNQVWKWQIDGYLHLKWEQRGLGRNEGSLHQVLYIHFYGSFLLSLLLN